jgi:hypothetical protein
MVGHSLTTQSLYKKILDSEDENDNNIIEQLDANIDKINESMLLKPKIGRPEKYNTDEERKLARQQAKKRFIEKQKNIKN